MTGEYNRYPLLAGIPILVIQLWLSVTMKNQAIPLTIGIFASVFAVYVHVRKEVKALIS